MVRHTIDRANEIVCGNPPKVNDASVPRENGLNTKEIKNRTGIGKAPYCPWKVYDKLRIPC